MVRAQDHEEYANGYQPITNDQFFGRSTTNPELLLFQGEIAAKNQDWDRAIYYLRQSLDLNDDDIDSHKFLALCLEQKIKAQPEKDLGMFQECIKEWLIVLRSERGPEKGLNFKNGTPVPGASKYDDEEGAGMARVHIKKLTGFIPGNRETDKKFLARVFAPTEERVSAKLMSKKPAPRGEDKTE